MLQLLRPCALALMLAAPVAAFSAEVPWRFLPQLPVSTEGLPVFVDLDGDGVNEIVFGAQILDLNLPGLPDAFALSVLGQVAGGPLQPVATVPLPQTLFSLVPVRRPGHADSVLVTVGLYGPTRMLEFTGRDLQRVRDVIVPELTRLHAVADIDADGALDVLGDTSASFIWGYPQVLDYATGAVRWQGPDQTQGVIAAQLDADPALEIISRGIVGRIYDGATGLQEWAWPGGFGQSVVSGRFEADPLIPGFATQDYADTTVFRASPYSPLRDFPGRHPLAAFDADGDGRDELYATRQNVRDLIRISALDGSVEPLHGPIPTPAPPRLGRLQSSGAALAALTSIETSTIQAGAFRVFDLDAMQLRYDVDYHKAPWWPAAFVQPVPAGPVLAAGLVGRYPADAQGYRIDLELRDAASGAAAATRSDLFPEGSYSAEVSLMAADIDGVPGDEIVVLRNGTYAAAVALIDGSTLQDRWRVLGAQSPLDEVSVRGSALVDFNQDGVKDVVLATWSIFGTGVRLLVLSGTDGAQLWQSVAIPDLNTNTRVGLVAGEVDAQPGSEIVLAVANAVYAFDTQTGLTTWIVKAGAPERFADVVHWGSGGDCRIGVVIPGELLRLLSCVDREPITSIVLPPGGGRVAPLDARGRVLATTTTAGDLSVSRDGGFFQSELTGLGAALSLNWPWAVQSTPGSISVLLGSSLQLLRVDLDDDLVFASGFEVLP